MINGYDNERVGYANTLRAAEAAGNQAGDRRIESHCALSRGGRLAAARQDRARRGSGPCFSAGLTYRRSTYDYYEHLFQLSPEYTEQDVAAIDKGSALSLGAAVAGHGELQLQQRRQV